MNDLSLEDYQIVSAETAIYPGAGEEASIGGLSYVTLGLTGEAGEIANKVKKIIRDHRGTITAKARNELAGELGDVLWYVAQVATQLGVSLNQVAELNLVKLQDRKQRNVIQGSGDHR